MLQSRRARPRVNPYLMSLTEWDFSVELQRRFNGALQLTHIL